MKPRLVGLLRCPACQEGLAVGSIKKEDGAEIIEAELRCARGHAFPIERGVPRLVSAAQYDESHGQTRDSFSSKWTRYGNTVWKSEEYREFQRTWFLQRYGFTDANHLASFLGRKRLVLDAGCGVGMAVGWFSDATKADVIGVDIGDATDVAFEQVGRRPNVHIIQADITNLPIADGTIDHLSCDQVIHHTTSPPATFAHLAQKLGPGASIGIYAYRRKGPIREFSDDYIREKTVEMSVDECLEVSETITELGRALSQLNAKIQLPRGVPILGIPPGEHDVQRLVYWHVMKCFWNEGMGWDVSVATNFDWYHPRHAYRYSMDELVQWYKDAGLAVEHAHSTESGYSLIGGAGSSG